MGLVSCQGDMCLGHESSGLIAQLGSNLAAVARKADEALKGAKNIPKGAAKQVLRVGDRVTLEPGVTCRMCPDCRGGRYQVSCAKQRSTESRFDSDPPRSASIWPLRLTRLLTGLFNDTTSCKSFRLYLPQDNTLTYSPADLVYPLPDSVDLVYGAMMEPLSVAVHGIANVGKLRTGENVLIFGAGPVGLLAMGVAKGLGAGRIIAVDINEDRLNFAKTYAATDIYTPVSFCVHRIVDASRPAEWTDQAGQGREQAGLLAPSCERSARVSGHSTKGPRMY